MGASIHTRSAELPVKMPYLTVRVPLLPIAPPYCADSNRKVRKEKKVGKSLAGISSMLRANGEVHLPKSSATKSNFVEALRKHCRSVAGTSRTHCGSDDTVSSGSEANCSNSRQGHRAELTYPWHDLRAGHWPTAIIPGPSAIPSFKYI